MRKTLLIFVAVVALTGCERRKFTHSMKLGGKVVSAETLKTGYEGFMLYCYACHGENGDGKGPAAYSLRPPPRDFRLGKFKFGGVASGQLPRDEDFVRIVKGGLHGTAMLPWDVPDKTLASVIQFIKTFSPRWKDEEPGEPIQVTPDPFGPARAKEAIARGKKVYHGMAQCWTCHPAYATKKEIFEAAKELRHVESIEFRDDMYHAALKDSDYGFNILPPDLAAQPLRSIREGHEMEDLFRVIASGIGGTAMPQWKGSLPDEEIWAMAWFVRSLMDMRDTGAEVAMRNEFASQPEFAPPAPQPEEQKAPQKKQ